MTMVSDIGRGRLGSDFLGELIGPEDGSYSDARAIWKRRRRPAVRSDPRLIGLSEMALAHTLASTRNMFEILYPDQIRRPGTSLDDIAAYFTAVDTAATVSKLTQTRVDPAALREMSRRTPPSSSTPTGFDQDTRTPPTP